MQGGKKDGFVIAIDGPAASGKGTLARKLAAHYGLHHLDTGLSYRAVAHAMIDAGHDLDNATQAILTADTVDLGKLDRDVLSTHAVGNGASKVAVIPQVRRILVEKQRSFSQQLPGAVLDGRDIGTVVCPDAPVKLYVTASAQVRARRRYDEEIGKGKSADLDAILTDIEARDARDIGRTDSPLRPAADAHLLDTSKMSIEAAFSAACAFVDRAMAEKRI